MKRRCVIFISNDIAKSLCNNLGRLIFKEGIDIYDKLEKYPISPFDLRKYYNELPLKDGFAVIEINADVRYKLYVIDRDDIISININAGNGIFLPIYMVGSPVMFSRRTNLLTGVIGWVAPDLTLPQERNRECMEAKAYKKYFGGGNEDINGLCPRA